MRTSITRRRRFGARARRAFGAVLLGWGSAVSYAAAGAPPILLDEAEQLAAQSDPALRATAALAQALDEAAVADGQLPDPRFKFSLFNFPTDTFNRTQEPLTQLRFGVHQSFPRGDTLDLQSQRTGVLAQATRLRNKGARLAVIRDVRSVWLEAFYWDRAERVVRENIDLFAQLVDITESRYAAGRQNQQDVLRAQLELSRLDDRLTSIENQQESARARLARWIGEAAERPLPVVFPLLPAVVGKEELISRLPDHPALDAEQQQVRASALEVDIAREAYKPGWSLDVDYGLRDGSNPDGSERADFLTALVVVDIPLFTDKRQDRRLAAQQQRMSAARLDYDDRFRDLKSRIAVEYAAWRRLGERLVLYEKGLVPKARENSQATLHAYQNDRSDFTALMRAQIIELDTRLDTLRLRVDRAKAQANLLYFSGETS